MSNNTKNEETTIATDSSKREDLITQLMMDNFDLDLNKDNRFEKGRKIYYYEIAYYDIEKPKDIIKETKVLKTQNSQKFNFEVNGCIYKINLNKNNSNARRNYIEDKSKESKEKEKKEDEISLHSLKSSSSNKEKQNDNVNEQKTQKEKDGDFNTKFLRDVINNKTFILKITHTSHEVDGNLIVTKDIDIRNGLKEILYYPKIDGEYIETEPESTKNDEDFKKYELINKGTEEISTKGEEHENKDKETKKEFKEDTSENEEDIPEKKKIIKSTEEHKETIELTKIKKNSKILLEVKQNTSLTTLFDQIEKVINDLKIFLPKERYYYFGFVNEHNAKKFLQENKFIMRIKKFEMENPCYKIFLFIIKNNTFFDLELKDKADYPTFYRNELKKEIGGIKKEIGEMKKEIGGMEKEIGGIKSEINGLRTDIKNEFEKLSNMILNLNTHKQPENDQTPK